MIGVSCVIDAACEIQMIFLCHEYIITENRHDMQCPRLWVYAFLLKNSNIAWVCGWGACDCVDFDPVYGGLLLVSSKLTVILH